MTAPDLTSLRLLANKYRDIGESFWNNNKKLTPIQAAEGRGAFVWCAEMLEGWIEQQEKGE